MLIIGAGSYTALLIAEFTELSEREPVLVASNPRYPKSPLLKNLRTHFVGGDELASFSSWKDKRFVVAIGNEFGKNRRLIYDKLCTLGGEPISLVSNTAIVKSPTVAGTIVLPGAYIGHFCTIGQNTIINTKASIDHESIIGENCHCMGGSVITGRVVIQNNCTIGANSTILPDINIGNGSIVGAGAVVTKNILPETINMGVPSVSTRPWIEAIINANFDFLNHFG